MTTTCWSPFPPFFNRTPEAIMRRIMPRIKHGFHTGVLASLLSIGLNSWASAPQTPALNLMPYPQQVELESGHWILNSSAALALSSPDQTPINVALERFRARFQRHTQT